MSITPETPASERTLSARIAVETMWAQCEDRSARTAPARAALEQKFLDEAGGDPVKAAHRRKAHFSRMALRSAQARRRAKEQITAAEAAEAELRELDEPSPLEPSPLEPTGTLGRNKGRAL